MTALLALLVLGSASAQDRTLDEDDVLRRSERVDPGEELVHFDVGDLDLKLQLGFAGNSFGPQTLLTAFLNWFEVQLSGDIGVYQTGDYTIGLGLEAWIGRPWIPESVTELRSQAGAELNWRAVTRGLLARATMHYTGLSTIDPYAVVLVGPSADGVRAIDRQTDAHGTFRTAGLRVGVGAGLNLITTDRVVAGFELRYLATPRFQRGEDVPLRVDGEPTDSFTVGRAQRSPRGFAWIIAIGLRR